MRGLWKLLCLVLLVLTPTMGESGELGKLRVKTLQNNGPSKSKFDIVFVGDGFLAKDQNKFDAGVEKCLSILWSVSPFRELKDRFNVHVVYVESKPAQGYGPNGRRAAEYPFGSTYADNDSGMVVLSKKEKVKEAVKAAPDVDATIVITTLSGRSHAGSLVLIADSPDVLPHEMGHLIGKLGDEYSSRSKLVDRENYPLPRGELPYPNIQIESSIDTKSRDSIKKTAKWGHFIDLPDADPIVSAYQGGYYREVGVWRPSYSCVMRSNQGALFCPVCHEELYKAILKKCGESFNDKTYHQQFPLKNWKSKMY